MADHPREYVLESTPMRQISSKLFQTRQTEICSALERIDGGAKFQSDEWTRVESEGSYGGGGLTRILRDGNVFEQAGVNFSEVFGTLPPDMSEKLTGKRESASFYATGVSLVIHPVSPMIPTTHANFRYLEVSGLKWFGGGMDLTPYYLFAEDAVHYHRVNKLACDRHNPTYYESFKKQCDEYFYLPHRGETRGIGGVFFDYLGKEEPEKMETLFPFMEDISSAFLDAYLPIVERRMKESWGEEEKRFQLIRRGRYVEFNLLYDRGTLFGLRTGGRIESILMSLPPVVNWLYDYKPEEGTRESYLLEVLQTPKAWL